MAAPTTDDGDDDWVVLVCNDSQLIERPSQETIHLSQISISTAGISSWDLTSILNHHTIKVIINRSRLIEQSTYFRSLLAGNFSESSTCSIPVHWNLEMFLCMLRFMHGYHMEVAFCSFLTLLEGFETWFIHCVQTALYFGLEGLVLQCKTWFSDGKMKEGLSSEKLLLDDLVRFWDFGLEHAINWLVEHCISCVAINFMFAMSCDTFVDLPYNFLFSCIKHPHLTVDSERHLCEALQAWVSANIDPAQQTCGSEDAVIDDYHQRSKNQNDWINILEEIRVGLLPLWFTMGKCRCSYFSEFAKQGVAETVSLLKRFSRDLKLLDVAGDWNYLGIRLTEYSKKLDLSGCLQITSFNLLCSVLDQSQFLNVLRTANFDLEFSEALVLLPTLSFKSVVEVDISKCFQLELVSAVDWLKKSFPSLKFIRMAYFLDFETERLCQLFQDTSVSEIDLTVDASPLLASKVSVLYSETVSRPRQKSYFGQRPTLSNITKLTLEGRTDFSDAELHEIRECCYSLCYLNIRGCLTVTDIGIANFIISCRKLHSIIASDTSFGRSSISALCSLGAGAAPQSEIDKELVKPSHINLQMLHIGGCKGICERSLVDILSVGLMVKSLCLRDTCLVDQALYKFPGSSLEVLDVSHTMVSGDALSHTITKNPHLKVLEVKGCRNLCLLRNKNIEEEFVSLFPCQKLFGVKECQLEALAIGWGFSDLSVNAFGSALKHLKVLEVGLGGSLGPEGLNLLCALCPLLESVSLLFQVVSDTVVINLLGTMTKLQTLSLRYCVGDVSPLILKCYAPSLKKLSLERVTPWMTNDNLALLTQNCANLIELSLVGCKYLDGGAQLIISSGWPGLLSLHLEDCGAVTGNGVGALFDCKAMEDLLLRHNGRGIQRTFIAHAVSKLPMLRGLSLDWCDASEGDLDLPNFADRYSLSVVKISRCKLQKCSLDFHNIDAPKRPVHKESLVLVWNSTSLQRTVIKERIT